MDWRRRYQRLTRGVAAPAARAAARARALHSSRVAGWAPGVVLAALGQWEIHDAGWDPASWLGLAVLLATVPLVWRRRHPVGVAYLVVAGSVLANLIYQLQFPALFPDSPRFQDVQPGTFPGGADDAGEPIVWVAYLQLIIPTFTLLVAVYLLVRHGTPRSRWLMAATGVALLTVPLVPLGPAETALWVGIGGLVAAAFGDAGRTRSQLRNERAAAMAKMIAAERQQAILAERARIARELHDVVAHSVSVIAVRAELSPYSVPDLSAGARDGFREIAASARAAMGELRQLLDVLRGEDAAAELAPQPCLDQLDDLLRQHRDAGGVVELRTSGERRPFGVPTELSAYRIVQEALTNARKHAPGARTQVEISYLPDRLTLRVTDDGPGPAAPPLAGDGPRGDLQDRGVPVGHGLLGMRERASILGGELTAGPRPAGGFAVTAELPLHPDEGAGR